MCVLIFAVIEILISVKRENLNSIEKTLFYYCHMVNNALKFMLITNQVKHGNYMFKYYANPIIYLFIYIFSNYIKIII